MRPGVHARRRRLRRERAPAGSLLPIERYKRSIKDHLHIIEALEARDTELAERLVREHTLDLARHMAEHFDYLASRRA